MTNSALMSTQARNRLATLSLLRIPLLLRGLMLPASGYREFSEARVTAKRLCRVD